MRLIVPSSSQPDSASIIPEEEFRITVLGADRFQVDCRPEKQIGRRLLVRLPILLPRDTCVRIDARDAMLLGEVLGSWREGSTIFGVIELQHGLTGLRELRRPFAGTGKVSEQAA
jgi:hypothetical protein